MCSELPLSIRVPIVYIPKVCLATRTVNMNTYSVCMYEYMYKDVMRNAYSSLVLSRGKGSGDH